jgi:hypothetical protein
MPLFAKTEEAGFDSLEQIIHDCSSLSFASFASFWCGGSLGSWSFGGSGGVLFSTWGSFLGLHLFDVSFSDLLLGSLKSLISGGGVLSSSSSDFIKRHTNNGLLDSGSSSCSLLLDVFDLDFLVESSGSLSPSKLDWLDLLVE